MKKSLIKIWAMFAFASVAFTLAGCGGYYQLEQLQKAVEQEKERLSNGEPDGSGMEFLDATVGSNDVVFSFSVDEKTAGVTMENLKTAKLEIKQNVLNSLEESVEEDLNTEKEIRLCIECDRGIVYKYTSTTSGESVKIRISSEELKALLPSD